MQCCLMDMFSLPVIKDSQATRHFICGVRWAYNDAEQVYNVPAELIEI